MTEQRQRDRLDAQLVARGTEGRGLDAIFSARSVAVIGASERNGSVGRTILWNLLRNPFGGTVYPINPKRSSVLGVRAYAGISQLPEPVDLAVIVTPAPTVPAVLEQCAAAQVGGVIVISAGFKEVGEEGAALERQILSTARRSGIRIVGPNCLGVMNPRSGLNATFASAMARQGNVGFISQSGALCTAVLDWSLTENVGFSAFVSLGSMLDVGWGDLIDYLGDDPHTESIVIYMETIGDARSFMSAAREVALTKPIIVIKPGRTEAGARAAASHTGSLTGSDTVLDAAFKRCGVLRVESIAELFNVAEVLGKQPRARGRRLAIVTNAGGPGVLATDALIGGGGELAPLSAEALQQLDADLPAHWSHNNPVDILGDADPERYERAVETVAADNDTDGVLVVLTPQAMTDPTRTAEQLKRFAQLEGKPFLASWMGGAETAAGEAILNRASVPTFRYPDSAARVFNYMWRHDEVLRAIYERPMGIDAAWEPARGEVEQVISRAHSAGREILSEAESKAILAGYGLPVIPTRVAEDADHAVRLAEEIGYPVVVKLHSETITHKSDVGGVCLNLANADAVRDAFRGIQVAVQQRFGAGHFLGATVQPMVARDGYELIAGVSFDAQLGPVLLFGAGGTLVEVFRDRAVEMPPLNRALARRLMARTRIWKALIGTRGKPPVDLDALELALVRLSELVGEQPLIREIDINPLLATPENLTALDARVVLHSREDIARGLPRPAIRAYPRAYVWRDRVLADGVSRVSIRPIRPEDEPALIRFHETLSAKTVMQRYERALGLGDRVARDRLIRSCFADYDRQILLVATVQQNGGQEPMIVGAARLNRSRSREEGIFALLVSDAYQQRGIGRELLARLIEVGRGERLSRLTALIRRDNETIRSLCEKSGFAIEQQEDSEHDRAVLRL